MISKYGFYCISKKTTTNETVEKIKTELRITPVSFSFKRKGAFKPVPPEPIELLMETTSNYVLPRFYGISQFGEPKANHMYDGDQIVCPFQGSLYAEQELPIRLVLERLNHQNNSGGILSLPCGEGKTVSALYILSQVSRKTIIVVHKEFLMNQWEQEIKTFLPNAKIGIIQGSQFVVDGCDIVLAMIQTMAKRDYTYEQLMCFGLSIYDECHHLGAKMFSKVLQKIPSKKILGLSAEPIRKDGMNLVFDYSIGSVIFQRERKDTSNVIVYKIVVDSESEYYQEACDRFGNKMLYKMEENIVTCPKRNQLIVRIIQNLFEDTTVFRQILVLTARNEGHIPFLQKMISDVCPNLKVGLYIGRNGTNKKLHNQMLQDSMTCDVILATYDMAMEGLNIKTLNTILLGSPLVGLQVQNIHGEKKVFCNDIKQTIGRILRDKHSDTPRIVYDIVDNFANYIQWASQRTRYYNKEKYNIQKININLDKLDVSTFSINKYEPTFEKIEHLSESDNSETEQSPKTKKPKCMIRIV